MTAIKILGITLQNLFYGDCSCNNSTSSSGNLSYLDENWFDKENLEFEQRIAIAPEVIKAKSLDINIILPKGYGEHLGISDQEFKNGGAEIFGNDEKILSEADAILQMSLISDKNFEKCKSNQFLIGVLNPYSNKEKIQKLIDKKINCFSLELLPELQGSINGYTFFQANLAGYKQ